VGLGVAVTAAAAAAAAGAYFLYGSKDATKNRKKVKSWMLKARAEVLENIEKMQKELSREDYEKLVEKVVTQYQKVGSASMDEVNGIMRELKGHWKKIHKAASQKRSVRKPAKKSARKKSAKKKTQKRSSR